MSRLIDADKLVEELISFSMNITGSHHHNFIVSQCKNSIKRIIDEQPTVGEWIPASQPPNNFEQHSCSEDVLVKLKWDDGDISYSVGFYHKEHGWSEDSNNTETIAWMPLPWMKLSELYQPEGGE